MTLAENDFAKILNEKFPNFKREWNQIAKQLGQEFISDLRKALSSDLSLLNNFATFQLTIVIDNNFILGQIKGFVEKNKKYEESFIYKLITTSFVKVYAPPALEEELYEKIDEVLEDEHKELAIKYASLILPKITILNAQRPEEWEKANNLIGHIDEDDVPYLALVFNIHSHGIISDDRQVYVKNKKFIEEQDNHKVKVWTYDKRRNVGEIITNYQSGCLSFTCIGSLGFVLKIIWDICIAFFKLLAEIIMQIIRGISYVLAGTIELLSKLPKEILIILGALGILSAIMYVASEDFRKTANDMMTKFADIAHDILKQLHEFAINIINVIQELQEFFKPFAITSFEILGYITYEYQLMIEQIQKLETERAT